jgi:predicted nucleotidyltransferase
MSYNNKYRTIDDILKVLLKIDYELGQIPVQKKVQLVIFGGTALLLKTESHFTSDIDAFIIAEEEEQKVRDVLKKYTVNDQLDGVMEFPPKEDWSRPENQERLNIDFNHLDVRLPSTEMLIISKLTTTRQTEKDVLDVIRSEILEQANHRQLRELYEEYMGYVTLPKWRYNSLDDVLQMWEDYKNKKGR